MEKLDQKVRNLCEENATSYVAVFDSRWALKYGEPILQIKTDAEK